MDDTFAIALASLQQDLSRIDRVAQNLVNAATPGYKQDVTGPVSFARVVDHLAGAAAQPAPATQLLAPPLQTLVDIRPGSMKLTGEPLDLAITGDGFFEVKTESGFAYTRQGDFHVDATGRLVTVDGHPVMGTDGEIHLTSMTPSIDATGAISDLDASGTETGPVGRIKVVRFQDPKTLQRLSGGLFYAEGAMPLAEGETQVRQGALENSNVDSAHEMVQMIQTARHFESMGKVIQGYDEMIGSAIHKLGDLS